MYAVEMQIKEDNWIPPQDFDVLADAIRYIERHSVYGLAPRAWINNKEVTLHCHRVVDSLGEPMCTNPYWHQLWATELDRIRSAPTNPQTLIEIAEANRLAALCVLDGEDRKGA